MPQKTLPFTKEQIERVLEEYPTPFHIYDEAGIRQGARGLNRDFARIPEYKNYFALKALPNPHILQPLHEEGMGVDCSSMFELQIAAMTGLHGEEIMFTSNGTPAAEYKKARELGAIINLDDITHLPFLEQHAGLPELLCFRLNPGKLKKSSDDNPIGRPENAKFGVTTKQIFDAYRQAKAKGVKSFGLHAMVESNCLEADSFADTYNILFDIAAKISQEIRINFEFINLGGGFGIPYRPEQEALDPKKISEVVEEAYRKHLHHNGLTPKIFTECGRFVTGPHGYLVTRVEHVEHKYKDFVKVDASMSDLARASIYPSAYHHITVLGKETLPTNHVYDVTGSLCENNERFARGRALPEIERGDILIVHDTGAHGHAMGGNYNAKLRHAELLFEEDRSVRLIRRAETYEDYTATLTPLRTKNSS